MQHKDSCHRYEQLPAEILPIEAFCETRREVTHKLPNVFIIMNGYLMVHRSIAEILQAHQLGKAQLIPPLKIYEPKGEECVYDGKYYFVNIAENHRFFIPEYHEDCSRREMGGLALYQAHGDSKVVPVSEETMHSDVDIWHDPLTHNSVYLSDQL